MRTLYLRRYLSSFILLAGCLFGLASSAHGQCTYKVINLRNDTASFKIPCDFPLKPVTGDATADKAAFVLAFVAWNESGDAIKSALLPTIATTGIKAVYFEITTATLESYSTERRTAILADPSFYHILP